MGLIKSCCGSATQIRVGTAVGSAVYWLVQGDARNHGVRNGAAFVFRVACCRGLALSLVLARVLSFNTAGNLWSSFHCAKGVLGNNVAALVLTVPCSICLALRAVGTLLVDWTTAHWLEDLGTKQVVLSHILAAV